MAKKTFTTKRCDKCHAVFMPTGGRQASCIKCRKKSKIKYDKNRGKTNYVKYMQESFKAFNPPKVKRSCIGFFCEGIKIHSLNKGRRMCKKCIDYANKNDF